MSGAEERVPTIGVRELHACLHDGRRERLAQVVDVREDWEWAQGHIAGATHIPLQDVPGRLSELDPARDVYFICHLGGRSEMATRFARRHGFPQAINVEGGMDAWEASNYPISTAS